MCCAPFAVSFCMIGNRASPEKAMIVYCPHVFGTSEKLYNFGTGEK
jgi:hypothetical protein